MSETSYDLGITENILDYFQMVPMRLHSRKRVRGQAYVRFRIFLN